MPANDRQISTLTELTKMLANGDLRLINDPDAVYVKLAQNNESNAVLRAFLEVAAASDTVHAVDNEDAFFKIQNENLLCLWSEYSLRYRVTHKMFEPTCSQFSTCRLCNSTIGVRHAGNNNVHYAGCRNGRLQRRASDHVPVSQDVQHTDTPHICQSHRRTYTGYRARCRQVSRNAADWQVPKWGRRR
jgi:hypothetical protein